MSRSRNCLYPSISTKARVCSRPCGRCASNNQCAQKASGKRDERTAAVTSGESSRSVPTCVFRRKRGMNATQARGNAPGGGSSLSKEPPSQKLMDRKPAQVTSNLGRMLAVNSDTRQAGGKASRTGLLRQRQSTWNKVAAIRYDSHSRRHC
jgi:hypothetical protein